MKLDVSLFRCITFLLCLCPFVGHADELNKYVDKTSFPNVTTIISHRDLVNVIKIDNALVKGAGSLRKAQISVVNTSDQRLGLEYRMDWFDNDGFQLGDSGIWQRFTLGAFDSKSFTSLAKRRRANSVQFTVRLPSDTLNDPRNSGFFDN
jgi:uncharacterized protein YcfL